MDPGALLFPVVLLAGVSACSGNAAVENPDDNLTIPTPGCTAARTGDHYEFLDDVCQRKVWPSNSDRNWQCPNRASQIPAGYAPATPLENVKVDTTALADLTKSLDVTVIMVKRDSDGKPSYRYYSNGTQDRAFEPLSSTKFMAVANGAATLRARSNLKVGLPATTSGVPLGDLISIIHNYNEQHFESNALARYFQNIGGRARANDLIHDGWLHRPDSESFGGNYGSPAASLPYSFTMPNGDKFSIAPDDQAGLPNHLSTLTMSEFLKRLVMHREDASTRLPGIQWDDLKVLFYGAEREVFFPLPSESAVPHPRGLGGMTADAAIYLQSAADMKSVEAASHGQWRVFSKLGYGNSGFVENGYLCFPELDANGRAIPDHGVELIISTHFGQASDNPPVSRRTDAVIAANYKEIVARARAGKL